MIKLPNYKLIAYEFGDVVQDNDLTKLVSLYCELYHKYRSSEEALTMYFNWYMSLTESKLKTIGLVYAHEIKGNSRYECEMFIVTGYSQVSSEDYCIISKYNDCGSVGIWANYFHRYRGERVI